VSGPVTLCNRLISHLCCFMYLDYDFECFPYVWYSTCHMCCFVYPGYDFECFPMFGILHVTCVVLCIQVMILKWSLLLIFTSHTCCFVFPVIDILNKL
jgi:hypothetical protein